MWMCFLIRRIIIIIIFAFHKYSKFHERKENSFILKPYTNDLQSNLFFMDALLSGHLAFMDNFVCFLLDFVFICGQTCLTWTKDTKLSQNKHFYMFRVATFRFRLNSPCFPCVHDQFPCAFQYINIKYYFYKWPPLPFTAILSSLLFNNNIKSSF